MSISNSALGYTVDFSATVRHETRSVAYPIATFRMEFGCKTESQTLWRFRGEADAPLHVNRGMKQSVTLTTVGRKRHGIVKWLQMAERAGWPRVVVAELRTRINNYLAGTEGVQWPAYNPKSWSWQEGIASSN